jgi:hypothetical protein
VVFQVVIFFLDDNLEVVLGACCLQFYEHAGTTYVSHTEQPAGLDYNKNDLRTTTVKFKKENIVKYGP